MSRNLVGASAVIGVMYAMSLLSAQESNGTKKSLQPSESQPKTTTTAPLRPLIPPARPPRLTDGATGEDGEPLVEPSETETVAVTVTGVRRRDPDLVMATWIALDNLHEIAVADLATSRASNSDVKNFAKMIAEDHIAFQNSLKAFSPAAINADYLNTTAKDARELNAEARQLDRSPPVPEEPATIADQGPIPKTGLRAIDKAKVPSANRDFSMVQIERELATQSLASSRKILDEKRGVEFDREFLAQEIAMHKALRDKLIIYQRHVSGPLAEIFSNGEQACEQHIAKATLLMKGLPATAAVRSDVVPAIIKKLTGKR